MKGATVYPADRTARAALQKKPAHMAPVSSLCRAKETPSAIQQAIRKLR
jgi:hypothetical protein